MSIHRWTNAIEHELEAAVLNLGILQQQTQAVWVYHSVQRL